MPDKAETRPLLAARATTAQEVLQDAVETLALARAEGIPRGRLDKWVQQVKAAQEQEAVARTLLALADSQWAAEERAALEQQAQ